MGAGAAPDWGLIDASIMAGACVDGSRIRDEPVDQAPEPDARGWGQEESDQGGSSMFSRINRLIHPLQVRLCYSEMLTVLFKPPKNSSSSSAVCFLLIVTMFYGAKNAKLMRVPAAVGSC